MQKESNMMICGKRMMVSNKIYSIYQCNCAKWNEIMPRWIIDKLILSER